MKTSEKPIAVILGDIDLLRPLVLADVPCAVVADRGDLPRYSRYARHIIEWADSWKQPEKLVKNLIDFASRQKSKPVLFYESDADLLVVSRFRNELGKHFRFVVPDADSVETLVDKSKFQLLADELSLPVPSTRFLKESDVFSGEDFKFPVIVKPLTRKVSEWSPIAGLSKGVRIETVEKLNEFIKSHAADGASEYLAQELIPGAESAIESYHVYVGEDGKIAGEFTGKKIRTFPKEFGQSCALTISDAPDVSALGREITAKLDLRGLAKFDFKRAPDGKLYLLEVNPRFSLWHHLGAKAGVNLTEMVYCDLVGLPRPAFAEARAGTNWCRLWQDVVSAREAGISFFRWFMWAIRCEAKPGIYWDDPLPLVRAVLARGFDKFSPSFLHRRKMRLRASKAAAG